MAALPAVIERLEHQWHITVSAGLPGGSASWVGRATRIDGTQVVLKVGVPTHDLAPEAAALRAADGDGYVRLLAHEPEVNAVLLERLGGTLERSGLAPEHQLDVLAGVAVHAWRRPVTSADRAAAGPTKALKLAEAVARDWERLGRPCSESVLAEALANADALAGAHDPARNVWVHGDAHPGNVLRTPVRPGAPGGWVLIDPDPFLDDPCYDLGVALRDWAGRLDGPDPRAWLHERCHALATRAGQDPQTVWRWAFLERVSTGLYVCAFGAEVLGRRFLDSAEKLVTALSA